VLGSALRFFPVGCGADKFADLFKVQAHWLRPKRLAPRSALELVIDKKTNTDALNLKLGGTTLSVL
jgi:hypothetical protein